MGNDTEASFSLNLETNAGDVSAEAAAELEQFRQKIQSSNDAVKQMSAAMRSLRGTSDEVKAAKAQLKAMLDSERNAVSAANLTLLKQGVTYEKLADNARKLAAEKVRLDAKMKGDALAKSKADADAASSAIRAAGGPVSSLAGKFSTLKDILGGAGSAMGAVTLVVAGAVAAIAAFTVGAIAAGVALLRFIVTGADAARTLNLVREAATGSAANARNLGTQVDALASKVSTSKEALNALAVSLARTRLSGQAIVDTFNLVGQASDAMGDEVGKQLQNIVTRSQVSRRIQINPLELQGTGLKFQDIAAELAVQMRVGVKAAQAALYEGRVKLDDGAKALRAAVEKRFGEINARKLLSLDVQVQKFKERLAGLTADVRLEPLLRAFDELARLFDASTVSGATLKSLVTIIGNGIGPAFQAATPLAKAFLKGLILGALDVGIAFLTLRNSIRRTFDGEVFAGIDGARLAMNLARAAVFSVATAVFATAAAFGAIALSVSNTIKAFQSLYGGAKAAWAALAGLDWSKLGSQFVDGIVSGLVSGAASLRAAVVGLADKVKGAFTGELEIRSPSKVFKRYGRDTVDGYADEVEDGSSRVTSAIEAMAPGAPPASRVGVPGGGGAVVLNVHIHVSANVDGSGAAKALSEPSFLAQFTKVVEDMLLGAGVPTQAAVSP